MDLIQEIRKPIAESFREYERFFATLFHSDYRVLNDVLDYIHSKRGKQLRPTLVLLCAEACRGVTDKTIRSAAVIELLHTASLVHDDIVDDSPLRRGDEAIHARWTNKVAVLMGDYLLSQLNSILADLHLNSILAHVAEASKQLASGEVIQLHHGESMWISEDQYNLIIEHKTADLFAAAGAIGAISSGGTARQVTALKHFAYHLGMCFQLKDDVLDYSDAEDLGKPTMHDIRDGKVTLPLLISVKRALPQEAAAIRETAEALALSKAHIDPFEAEQEIKSFILRYDGIRYAYKVMDNHRHKAIEALSAFPDSKVKNSLSQLLDYAINRVF